MGKRKQRHLERDAPCGGKGPRRVLGSMWAPKVSGHTGSPCKRVGARLPRVHLSPLGASTSLASLLCSTCSCPAAHTPVPAPNHTVI